jgi:hypothetical protein
LRLWKYIHCRKNYFFAGSHDAAGRATALYGLTRTCAQYGVAPAPVLHGYTREGSFRDFDRSLDSLDSDFNEKVNCVLIPHLATARFIAQRKDAIFLSHQVRDAEVSSSC